LFLAVASARGLSRASGGQVELMAKEAPKTMASEIDEQRAGLSALALAAAKTRAIYRSRPHP